MKLSCDQLRRRFLQAGPLAVWSLLSHGAPSPVAAQARSTNERQLRPVDEKAGGAAAPPRAQFWLLAIGVDTTDKGQVEKLKYCAADARLLAKTLEEFCGYEPQRMRLLTSDQGMEGQPARRAIGMALNDLKEKATSQDTVVVFFAGHGYVNSDGEGFLVSQDFDLAQPNDTGVPINALRQKLTECKAQQKLLLLDCCHSGSVDIIFSSDKVTKQLKDSNGTITITSCGAEEKSYELERTGHGLFTYSLAEGLAGAADRDGNQIISSGELYQFGHDKTKAEAQANGWKQEPRQLIAPDVRGVFSIASVRPHPAVGQRLILLAEDLNGPHGHRRTQHGELQIEKVEVGSRFSGTQWRGGTYKEDMFTAGWEADGNLSLDIARGNYGVQFRGVVMPMVNTDAERKFAVGDLLKEGSVVYYAREATRDIYLLRPAPGVVFLSSLVDNNTAGRLARELRDRTYEWPLLQDDRVGIPPLRFADHNNFNVASATMNSAMVLRGLVCVPKEVLDKQNKRLMGLQITLDGHPQPTWSGQDQEFRCGYVRIPDVPIPQGTRTINIHYGEVKGKDLWSGNSVWSALRLVPVNKPPKS
jgi:hypothetical protein